MARTLKDYRPQHDEDCNLNKCARCDDGPRGLLHGNHTPWPEREHDFEPVHTCSCGLDALLAECAPAAPSEPDEVCTDGYCSTCGAIALMGANYCENHIPPPPPAPPETTEPRKYSACRICGRACAVIVFGPAIAAYGVHTDALHQPNQPNKGTAYCDHCEDETLVIQDRPAPQTPDHSDVEQARKTLEASIVCLLQVSSGHVDEFGRRTELVEGEVALALDALIAAVRREQAAEIADYARQVMCMNDVIREMTAEASRPRPSDVLARLEDARMGHVRLDECAGCEPGPLYDRISFVLQRTANDREEMRRKLIMVEQFVAKFSEDHNG